MSNVRRFFFDDGSSRKRWNVEVKGKSQLVAYGRLTGTLRESKKSFKTPAEAAKETEKLIAKKKREGYIEVNPARLRILRKKGQKKATDPQIKALEKQLGHTLPDEYRNFLKTVNGGRPNPDYIQLFNVSNMDSAAVETLLHFRTSKTDYDGILFQLDAWEDVIEGHVPIAHGGGDLITLSLEPKTFGAVYWWSHEVDEPGHLLASSFDEFLTRVAVADGDENEPVPAAGSGVAEKKPKATVRGLLKLVRHDHTPETIKEMEQIVKELGDLSCIEDGKWPYCIFDSPSLLRCLLEAGLNPEITDADGHSLLLQCAGNRECIELLAENGVRIDRRSGSRYETALMRAVSRKNVSAVERLLQFGANPTVRRLNGKRLILDHATETDKKLGNLIEKACIKWRKNGGWRKKALEAKAKREAADPDGKQSGPNPNIARLLELMDRNILTDECEDVEELEALIAALGDLSGIQDGEWPRIRIFQSPRVLYCLLEAGLNPEITDKEGESLLCQCVAHPECIELLLERDVEVDRRTGNQNRTALMQAAYRGCEDSVESLLNAGADPTLEFVPGSKMLPGLFDDMLRRIVAARKDWEHKMEMK